MTEPWWIDAAPSRPIKVEGGIQINSTRGGVARTWWSQRFMAVLESIGVGGRMARGRNYARAGQIVSLDVSAGGAVAQVQGSRPKPYAVRIGVPAFGKTEWSAVADALVADASYTAALLSGQMPPEIESVFTAVGLSLFPATTRDLALDCSCPDHAVPCKHLAAVFYVLAERFDADPFEILALRGRDRETLLEELRTRRAAASPAGPASGIAPLAELLDGFYTAGPGLAATTSPVTGPPTPSDALLDQLPAFPIDLRGATVIDLLRPGYQALGDTG
ncbi:SWIM zinc finger family protein [Pseudonocardia sp. GCM10023141]|uniref:SWIM zinc finger family protein n=1 Tax=Pseudonocardia sp. GCM10023141 TaxID=3252653 RepID=UPI0036060FB0